jgi:hypothetical protein
MTELHPLTLPRPNAGATLDWDRPVGYAHAASVLTVLTAHENHYQVANGA